MKNSKIIWFASGLLAGVLLSGLGVYLLMPRLMIAVRPSPLGLEETVAEIKRRAIALDWVVSGVSPIDQSVRQHGGGEVPATRLVNLCQAHHAAAILRDPAARKVSVFMPCTISVYQGDDGLTYVSSMNAGLLGRMMGGVVAEVMGGAVAAEQAQILSFLSPAHP